MDVTIVPKDPYSNSPVFIDSGGPDSYLLTNEFADFLNDTFNSSYPPFISGANETQNATTLTEEPVGEFILMAVLSLILGLMILVTVIGNVFVIAAIILERNLQNVANYLVASLAVADLLVACLVMPLGAVYEISRGWILGPELCDIWTSCDVLCCTASILHLVAIATDRFWAVTNVDYIHSRTSRRVFMMIFLVWFFAVIVSLAPQFGWKDPEYLQRIEQQKCMVSQDVGYQVFATCCTFYVPLFVILVLYWKIYQTARKRIRRRKPKLPIASNNNQDVPKPKRKLRFRIASKFTNSSNQEKSAVSSLGLVEGNSTNTVNTFEDPDDSTNNCEKKSGTEVTAFNAEEATSSGECQISTVSHQVEHQTASETIGHSINGNKNGASGSCSHHNQSNLPEANQNNNQTLSAASASAVAVSQLSTPVHPQPGGSRGIPTSQITKRKETLEAKRERKAAKTLAIITGAFVVCWLPFFLMALLLPLCEACHINDWIASLFLWLGYFNSTLNPVIYTIFSPEFRQAFKRILFGTHNRTTYRRGKL